MIDFRNIIHIQDLIDLYHEALRFPLRDLLSRFRLRKSSRTRAAWSSIDLPGKEWGNINRIQTHISLITTGNSNREYYDYIAEKYLKARQPLIALSLGSGRGYNELRWAGYCRFREFRGIELSPKLVAFANNLAAENRHSEITFAAGNVSNITLPAGYFDAVFVQHSLHHFSRMEKVIAIVNNCLKPGGLFIVDEYAGKNRLQWPDAQLRQANELLRQMPERYRKLWKLDKVKKHVQRPGLLRMYLADPSEAVESEKIRPLLNKHFETLELKEIGGPVLCPLFHDIGANFTDDDPEAMRIVDRCIQTEMELLRRGGIASDFFMGVFAKRGK
ncbi:MAG TPA: class I SAM-dependent methyltransferase [Chitinivibrionales bacterium]|nr:class I SAM-dependent methyltransferase [Chitinivibrionales bacterium]